MQPLACSYGGAPLSSAICIFVDVTYDGVSKRVMPVTKRHLADAIGIARQYGATRLLLFGSAVSNPETARDLDLAVDGVPGWDLFRMAAEMEEQIDVPLDVVPLDVDDPFIHLIEKQGRVLYEKE